MKLRTFLFVSGIVLLFAACRKDDSNLYLRGGVYHGDDQIAMGDVQLTVYKQVLQNGIFGASYSPAVSGVSQPNGLYQLAWERENFAALKLVAQRDQYVTREFVMNVSDFNAGDPVDLNVAMFPEAFIQVRILNTGQVANNDRCNFTFVNAAFECACCSNGWREFEGADLDTNFTCRLYGNRWLKYQRNLNTIETDTVIVDSVWCPAFETTEVLLEH
jgi:hypothetical protein